MDSHEVKLMCSYGGTIRCLAPDYKFHYVDGENKVLYVSRNISPSALVQKLRKICKHDVSEFKYQFPGKSSDVILVTVDEKDDLENMMREYDRLHRDSVTNPVIRLFISPPRNTNSTSSYYYDSD